MRNVVGVHALACWHPECRMRKACGGTKSFSPLTPALSPLRGEGDKEAFFALTLRAGEAQKTSANEFAQTRLLRAVAAGGPGRARLAGRKSAAGRTVAAAGVVSSAAAAG